jgi:putative protease
MLEEKVGTIDHFYTHLGVAAVRLQRGLKVGDTVHIKGHTSNFLQIIDSIEKEHHHVAAARGGESVGIRLTGRAREHDAVYKIIEENLSAS